MPQTSPRRHRRTIFAVAGLVLIGTATYGAFSLYDRVPPRAECVVEADGRRMELETQQAANAATISAVASSRDLPERALTIALATAMQESALRNLDGGDRDSVGLFQQRPSQGWGTVEQIMDPVYSSNEFFDHLVKVPGYSRLPLTVAAQKVQKSGFPQAYAKHETDAALLSSSLTGRRHGALNCMTGPASSGTAGDAAKVRERLVREFGEGVLPAPSGDGGNPDGNPAGKSGDSPEDTVTVPSAPLETDGPGGEEQRGWEFAHWAVTHADELKVERITYRDREWSAGKSDEGWRKSASGTDSDVRITVAR